MEKGLPIRNITTDPLGGELRERAEKFLKTIAPDARFVGDDAVIMSGGRQKQTRKEQTL